MYIQIIKFDSWVPYGHILIVFIFPIRHRIAVARSKKYVLSNSVLGNASTLMVFKSSLQASYSLLFTAFLRTPLALHTGNATGATGNAKVFLDLSRSCTC